METLSLTQPRGDRAFDRRVAKRAFSSGDDLRVSNRFDPWPKDARRNAHLFCQRRPPPKTHALSQLNAFPFSLFPFSYFLFSSMVSLFVRLQPSPLPCVGLKISRFSVVHCLLSYHSLDSFLNLWIDPLRWCYYVYGTLLRLLYELDFQNFNRLVIFFFF